LFIHTTFDLAGLNINVLMNVYMQFQTGLTDKEA